MEFWEQISKKQFLAYERVREEGRFNMVVDAWKAMEAAGLEEQQYWTILTNYGKLRKKFGA